MNKSSFPTFLIVLVGVFFFIYGSILFGSFIIVVGFLFQLKAKGLFSTIFSNATVEVVTEIKLLRLCIASYWVTFVAAMIVAFYEEQRLPVEIVQFGELELDMAPLWLSELMLAAFLIFMIGSMGVFFLKRWGRTTFVLGFFGMLFLSPPLGVSIVTPIFSLLDGVGDTIVGITICLLYFTPAKQYFEP